MPPPKSAPLDGPFFPPGLIKLASAPDSAGVEQRGGRRAAQLLGSPLSRAVASKGAASDGRGPGSWTWQSRGARRFPV